MRIQMQSLECLVALSAEIDHKFIYMAVVPSNILNIIYWKKLRVISGNILSSI